MSEAVAPFPVRWGAFFEPDVPAPPLTELFPEPNEHGYSYSWAFEDHLQNNEVFVNGLRGTPCHSDSYMTCVDYTRLKVVTDALKATFVIPVTHMTGMINALESVNQQPPMRLVAYELRRQYPEAAALAYTKEKQHEFSTRLG